MTDILAFGAHPDDIEFGCGAILAKMAAQGKKIVMVDLTLGDKATNGTPEQRRQEGLEAAKLIGAERIYLDFKDCEIIDSYESRLKLVAVIRRYKPKLVLAPLWKGEMNHPDHLACGVMARYACRYARFKNIMPELPSHAVGGILHYLYPFHAVADFLIDVSDYVDTWKKMLDCHGSQMQTLSYSNWNERIAHALGVAVEGQYAQGLVKGNSIIVDDVMVLSKQIREI
jgi:bacillithiol biosynthesis deacetylase BshB1